MTTAQNLANLSQVFSNGPLSHRNRFINGCMRVSQRGSVTASSGVVTYAAADRWYVWSNGASVTTSNTNGSPISPASLTAAGAAGNATLIMGQRIESTNISDLAGKVVTVSGWVYTPTTTPPSIMMYYPNSKDNYTGNTGIMSVTPLLPSINASTWTYFSFTTTLPSQVSAGLQVEFNFGAVTSGSAAISGMQLEAGAIATPFEMRPYTYELSACQRYYEFATLQYLTYAGTTGNSYGPNITFLVQKRVVPTVSYGTPSLANNANNGGVPSGGGYTPQAFCVTFAPTAVGFMQVNLNWYANAEL